MFLNAGPVVRSVMILLFIGCVLTWTVALAKTIEFTLARRRLEKAKDALESSSSLDQTDEACLLYQSPSPRDRQKPSMPSPA